MATNTSGSGECEILPEDLVFRILLLLPVASLLRFKSVCQSWLSLIESASFISQHTRRSHSEDKLIILNLNRSSPSTHNFISVADLQLSNHKDFKLNPNAKVGGIKLIASFDGIVCLAHHITICEWIRNEGIDEDFDLERDSMTILHDSMDVVTLWNPATKHAKILPPPLGNIQPVAHEYDYPCVYGFGFDVKTNDSRVVRVIVQELKEGSQVLKSHVQVYSLNMDYWRVIDAVVPVKIWVTSYPSRPFMNGNYCWSGWDFISKDPVLLLFDFSNEVFRIIPMNEIFGSIQVSIDYTSHSTIDFLREELACIHWVQGASIFENCRCKIWLLNNCGVKESWTKLYEIMFEPEVCPLGFSVNGKMVLEEQNHDNETQLFLLDPAVQELTGTPYRGTFANVAVYKESLVSVKGANGETYRVDSKPKAFSSRWDLTVSQMIVASSERIAGILDQYAGGSLIVFDEPKTVSHLPAQTTLPTRWSPPLAGTIKLNTDAIWKTARGLGAVGWVARNAAGTAVKTACSNPIPMDALVTGKAEAIRNALYGASNAGWDSIIIESDCEYLVYTIKGCMVKGASGRDYSFSCIIADIIILSTGFKFISFCFVPRSSNIAARTLACHGFKCDMPCTWGSLIPDWLSNVLAKDLVT